jgi:hypothetical protein
MSEKRKCIVCGELHNNIPPTCSRECSLIALDEQPDPFVVLLKPSYRDKNGKIKKAFKVENNNGELVCYIANKRDL